MHLRLEAKKLEKWQVKDLKLQKRLREKCQNQS